MTEWKKNAVHPLRIEGYTAEGMGVARLEGRVVFVPFTAQGELWRVRLEKVRPNMAWGRGVELLESSPERAQADCPLFGRCGGCQFRHLTYAEELRAKGQRIADALERVGGVRLDLPPLLAAGALRWATTAPEATTYWMWPTASSSRRPSPPCVWPFWGGWRTSTSLPTRRRPAPA